MSSNHIKFTKQKASKVYICYRCGEEIPIGHQYWKQEETNDWGSEYIREHINCLEYLKPLTAQTRKM